MPSHLSGYRPSRGACDILLKPHSTEAVLDAGLKQLQEPDPFLAVHIPVQVHTCGLVRPQPNQHAQSRVRYRRICLVSNQCRLPLRFPTGNAGEAPTTSQLGVRFLVRTFPGLGGALEPPAVEEAELGVCLCLSVWGEQEKSLEHAEEVMHGDEVVWAEGGGTEPHTDAAIYSNRGRTEGLHNNNNNNNNNNDRTLQPQVASGILRDTRAES